MTRLGALIKRGLKAKGENQAWLAGRVGLSDAQVSRIIHGESEPTFENLNLFAEVLGMRYEDVYRAARGLNPLPAEEQLIADIKDAVMKLPRHQQAGILATAQALEDAERKRDGDDGRRPRSSSTQVEQV